jgi:hypothetical protein
MLTTSTAYQARDFLEQQHELQALHRVEIPGGLVAMIMRGLLTRALARPPLLLTAGKLPGENGSRSPSDPPAPAHRHPFLILAPEALLSHGKSHVFVDGLVLDQTEVLKNYPSVPGA